MITKQEEYQLLFKKIITPDGLVFFNCEHKGNINKNQFIATLLRSLNTYEAEGIIEDINAALNGEFFEEYHSPDSIDVRDTIELSPPNVLIHEGVWSISMQDWEQLMQEWVDYQRANS